MTRSIGWPRRFWWELEAFRSAVESFLGRNTHTTRAFIDVAPMRARVRLPGVAPTECKDFFARLINRGQLTIPAPLYKTAEAGVTCDSIDEEKEEALETRTDNRKTNFFVFGFLCGSLCVSVAYSKS